MEKNKKFIVYFEVFNIKKKITVENPLITTQLEAEGYVKNFLIPNNTKFYSAEKINSNKETKTSNNSKMSDIFSGFEDLIGDFFKKK